MLTTSKSTRHNEEIMHKMKYLLHLKPKCLSRICLDFLHVYSYSDNNNITFPSKVTNTFYADVLYVKRN